MPASTEIFEETGLDVRITGVAGATEGSVPGVRFVLLIMEARTRATRVTLSEEHDSYRWMQLADVFELNLRPPFKEFFEDYARRQRL